MFARIRPPGGWTTNSTIPGSQFETIDANLANALDIVGGGAYAPVADIEIGGGVGVDWTFALPVFITEDLTTDQLIVGGFADFNAGAAFQDGVQFFSSVDVGGAATFDGLFTVNGDADFNNPAEFNDDVYLNGTALLCQSQAVFFDDVDIDVPLTVNANGLRRRRLLQRHRFPLPEPGCIFRHNDAARRGVFREFWQARLSFGR
jgi:hypothetical protein